MLYQIVQNSKTEGWAFILEHHVVFALLGGGLLISIGLITRVAILFVLPIFVGVIFNQNVSYGLYSEYGNLIFSLIITLSLILFLIGGSGGMSVDYLMKKKKIV